MAHIILKRHPELVSGSVRGQEQEKARGEMLKQVQHDVTKRKRLKDGMPKGRIAADLSPWKQKRRRNGVCKDAERQRGRGLKSPSVLKSPVFTDGLIVEPTRCPRV